MPGSATAEAIFIVAMMILIMIISLAAVYFFFRTWSKEKRERELNKQNSKIQDPRPEIK